MTKVERSEISRGRSYSDPREASFALDMMLVGFDVAGFDNWFENAVGWGRSTQSKAARQRLVEWRTKAVALHGAGNLEAAIAWAHAMATAWQLYEHRRVLLPIAKKSRGGDSRSKLPDDATIVADLKALSDAGRSPRDAKGVYCGQKNVTSQGLNARLRRITAKQAKRSGD